MKDNLTFESAINRLDEIISSLNSGVATLEDSLVLYAESAELLAYCNKTLEEAKLKIEEILPDPQTEE